MENRKKKIIIISSVIVIIFVSALAIVIFNNIKKEKELQEAIKLEQELEEKELKEQQEQEEKERQERLAKLEEGWNALGENQQYLTPNTEHFNVTYNDDNTWKFTYSAEFVKTLFLIEDGWFSKSSMDDINRVINIAIPMLPENPTGRDLFEKFVEIAQTKDRETVITGQGTSPYDYFGWGDKNTNTDTTQSQQTTNNNQSNNNNSSNKNNSNKNNSNKNTNSNSSSNNSDSDSYGGISSDEWCAANGWEDVGDDPGDVEIDEEEAKKFLEGLENFNGNNGGN